MALSTRQVLPTAVLLILGGFVATATCQMNGGEQLASRVCRPGPPLLPPTDGRKNCLVIGDSVSIGYTPYVTAMMNASCQVQHAPFSGDGGALDTKYAMQCFDQWMVTSMLENTTYDAIVINSGLHDVNYSGSYPEEYTSPDDYKTNFQLLKKRLLAYTPHVAVVSTTPVGYDTAINDLVIQYNQIAALVMHGEAPALNVIDLYAAVVEVCGTPPYNCSIQASPRNVHYNAKGYGILAAAVSNGFKTLLGEKASHHSTSDFHRHAHGMEKTSKLSGVHRSPDSSMMSSAAGTVCPGGKTACPQNTTCIIDHYSTTGYGCCYAQPQPMVDCKDSWHCCPHGWTCGKCSLHGCMCMSP